MTRNPTDVPRLDAHRDYGHAVPTPDHAGPPPEAAAVGSSTPTPRDVLPEASSI